MSFNINDFKARGLTLGGARPNQFEINIFPPFQNQAASKISMVAHSATVPPMEMGEAVAMYFGRAIKLAGDRTFPDWNVTIYNDEDFRIRTLFEDWSNRMNTLISNRMDPSVYATGYKVEATVRQFGKDGTPIREYIFEGLWPKVVDSMGLQWAAQNQIQEFNVTFAYDLWKPSPIVPVEGDYSPLLPSDGFSS